MGLISYSKLIHKAVFNHASDTMEGGYLNLVIISEIKKMERDELLHLQKLLPEDCVAEHRVDLEIKSRSPNKILGSSYRSQARILDNNFNNDQILIVTPRKNSDTT